MSLRNFFFLSFLSLFYLLIYQNVNSVSLHSHQNLPLASPSIKFQISPKTCNLHWRSIENKFCSQNNINNSSHPSQNFAIIIYAILIRIEINGNIPKFIYHLRRKYYFVMLHYIFNKSSLNRSKCICNIASEFYLFGAIVVSIDTYRSVIIHFLIAIANIMRTAGIVITIACNCYTPNE